MSFQKLPYANNLQLIDAFVKGATFRLTNTYTKRTLEITDIREAANGSLDVEYRSTAGHKETAPDFKCDGTYISRTWVIEMVSDVPPEAKPFLKRFVLGEPAYCPKTREVVIGVSFVKGAIEVLLKGEDGKERVSTRYDHEGKHSWVPERSLVFGELPPKPVVMKTMTLDLFKHERGFTCAYEQGSTYAKSARTIRSWKFLATVDVQVPA